MHKLKTKWWKQKGAKNCKARILQYLLNMYVYLYISIKCCITSHKKDRYKQRQAKTALTVSSFLLKLVVTGTYFRTL